MKRISVFFLAFCAILSCGCSANNPEIVENTAENSTAATTTATLAETTTTATKTSTETSAKTTTAATTTTAAETTTTTTTAAPAAATPESTVITTAETTTEKATAASTEIVTTTITKKTKKTKKTTTAVSKEPETTELSTTTETTSETTSETTISDEAPLPVTFEQQSDGSLLISGERYVMTFDDEFNGSNLDLTKWSRCPEWKRQDKNCYWEDDRSYLNGEGQLVLEATYDGDYSIRCLPRI